MSKKTKATGLGTNAFYPEGSDTAPATANTEAPEEVKKMRTTIMLPPDVVVGIEALRTQARKNGRRTTTSKIIEDAIKLLIRERKINLL